ncbi:hypothetical protein VTK56DRAFT_8568 [Thermocarpiscus australiensis]
MNSSVWDDEAEAYLRRVLTQVKGVGRGGVPCAWPTTIFEVSWAISALAPAGVPIGDGQTSVFLCLLRDSLNTQKGLLGFAPNILPDADDTAKGLEALHHLGHSSGIGALIRTYEVSEHFTTYPGERNPSFSANCNILILLLIREDRDQHLPQIVKALRFLTSQVFRGQVNEKWVS